MSNGNGKEAVNASNSKSGIMRLRFSHLADSTEEEGGDEGTVNMDTNEIKGASQSPWMPARMDKGKKPILVEVEDMEGV